MLQCHMMSFKSSAFLCRDVTKRHGSFAFWLSLNVLWTEPSYLSEALIFLYLPSSVAFRSRALIGLIYGWKTWTGMSRAAFWSLTCTFTCHALFLLKVTPYLQTFLAWVGVDKWQMINAGVQRIIWTVSLVSCGNRV